jgi:hypothetical protein
MAKLITEEFIKDDGGTGTTVTRKNTTNEILYKTFQLQ